MMFSCSDDDDDDNSCLVCEAFDDGNGTTADALDVCVGDDFDGETQTQEGIDFLRALYVTVGASCN